MTNNENLPKSGPDNARAAAVGTSYAPENAAESESTVTTPRHISVPRSLCPIFTAIFIGVLIVSNITATKGMEIFDLATDGVSFLFPLSHAIGGVLSECYGYRAARRTVQAGLVVLAGAMLCFFATIGLPAALWHGNQEAFTIVLDTVPQPVLADLVGYVVGQLFNAWSLNATKKHAGEKALWARLMGSTVVSEFVDTLIFCSTAATAIGIDTWGTFVNHVIVGFIWKIVVEMVTMPVTCAIIAQVKCRESYYDTHVPAQ